MTQGQRAMNNMKSVISESFRERYSKKANADIMSFDMHMKGIKECIRLNCEQSNDMLDDMRHEDLVFSNCSLQECKRRLEQDIIFMSEALLKTYPTKHLTSHVAKTLAHKLGVECIMFKNGIVDTDKDCIYSTKSQKTEQVTIDTQVNAAKSCALTQVIRNAENDVAGSVLYVARVPKTFDKKCKLMHDDIEKLILAGLQCGYDYVASSSFSDQKFSYVQVKYESKLQDNEINVADVLYHVAPMSSKEKILKQGLQPKTSDASLYGIAIRHSPKVYLFNGNDSLKHIPGFILQLSKNSKEFNSQTRDVELSKKFALFKIDRSKVKSKLRLFRDNMFETADMKNPIALYTYDNIPKEAIEFAGELNDDIGR